MTTVSLISAGCWPFVNNHVYICTTVIHFLLGDLSENGALYVISGIFIFCSCWHKTYCNSCGSFRLYEFRECYKRSKNTMHMSVRAIASAFLDPTVLY